ncbi:MAG: idnO, partial [Massilia sp.]|nr:idnO [Massilia sp.]
MSELTDKYKGKIVVVTGGSKGIGLACAKQFLAHEARVFICSRSQTNIDQALIELPGAIGFSADLSDENQANGFVERISKEFGPIDVLVNSAGAAKRAPVAELKPASWRAAMDAKFFSTINVLDPVIKLMAVRGKGVIINIIGSGGKVASPTHLA